MRTRIAIAAINILTCTTSYLTCMRSIDRIYSECLEYTGFFTETVIACSFEEHDLKTLNYPNLFPSRLLSVSIPRGG